MTANRISARGKQGNKIQVHKLESMGKGKKKSKIQNQFWKNRL